jgi:hypothetical protein
MLDPSRLADGDDNRITSPTRLTPYFGIVFLLDQCTRVDAQ